MIELHPMDIVVLAVVLAWFVFCCIRMYRKGTCADCAQGGYCTGHCSPRHRKSCAAMKGIDEVEQQLSQGIK